MRSVKLIQRNENPGERVADIAAKTGKRRRGSNRAVEAARLVNDAPIKLQEPRTRNQARGEGARAANSAAYQRRSG
jgi:hypothetical protein